MARCKSHLFFKLISTILIIIFTVTNIDTSFAQVHPQASPITISRIAVADDLAAQSPFQGEMMTDTADRFKQSIFSDIEMLTAVFSVSQYLLGDPEAGLKPLPLNYMESVLVTQNGKPFKNVDLSRATVKDGVVLLPGEKDGRRYVIQIALASKAPNASMVGYEWMISDKYMVKVLPEGYTEPANVTVPAAAPAVAPEKVTVSEPVAVVDITHKAPSDEEPSVKKVSIRSILGGRTLAVEPFSAALVITWITGFFAAHPTATIIASVIVGVLLLEILRRVIFKIGRNLKMLREWGHYPAKCEKAIKTLVSMGRCAVPRLMRCYDGPEGKAFFVQRGILEVLGRIGDRRAEPLIRRALEDKRGLMRGHIKAEAVLALARLHKGEKNEEIAGRIKKGLACRIGDEHDDRYAFVEAAAATKDRQFVAVLLGIAAGEWPADPDTGQKTYNPADDHDCRQRAIEVLNEVFGVPYSGFSDEIKKMAIRVFSQGGGDRFAPYDARYLSLLQKMFSGKIHLMLKRSVTWRGKGNAKTEALSDRNTALLIDCLMLGVPYDVKVEYPARYWVNAGEVSDYGKGGWWEHPPRKLTILPKGKLPATGTELQKLIEAPKRAAAEKKAAEERAAAEAKAAEERAAAEIEARVKEAEMLGRTFNSLRGEFINAANVLAASSGPEGAPLTSAMSALEIRTRAAAYLDRVVKSAGGIANTPDNVKKAAEIVSGKRAELEVNSLIAAIIAMAAKAKKDNQHILIGVETGWLPGLVDKSDPRYASFMALEKQLLSLGDTLRLIGLDNVVVVSGKGSNSELALAIGMGMGEKRIKKENVVCLATEETIMSRDFVASLKSTPTEKKAFLAGINTSAIKETLKSEEGSKKAFIDIMELLTLTLELAAGKEPPKNNPLIASYDKALRILILLPRPEIMDYEKIIQIYNTQRRILEAA